MLILFLNSLFKSRMYKVSFFNFKFSMYGYGRFLDKWFFIMIKFFGFIENVLIKEMLNMILRFFR